MASYKEYIEWDINSWAPALKFWENEIGKDLINNECIELGGRKGGLSLWLAEKGANVVCSDFENPKSIAEEIHNKFDTKGKITYQAVDASNIAYKNEFDIVILKSIIGGIARNGKDELKKKVINEIYQSLKPGGKLLFAENLEASKLHKFFRKKFVRWGKEWNYLSYSELADLFASYSSFKYNITGFLAAFGRKEWQRNIFAVFDKLFFNNIVNKKQMYIVYGVATK